MNCTGRGYPEPTVTLFVDDVELTGNDTSNCTGGVCTTTRSAALDGSSYTPGVNVSIKCSVDINQPPFKCTPTVTVAPACANAEKNLSQTRTVPVIGECLLFFD